VKNCSLCQNICREKCILSEIIFLFISSPKSLCRTVSFLIKYELRLEAILIQMIIKRYVKTKREVH